MAVTALAAVDVATHRPHSLHEPDRTWMEINCYVDLWIELLHWLGLDPRPASACALSADFMDDQWSFLKHPPEDLRALYGIEVGEINVWRDVLDHVEEHLRAGRLLTVEVDSWWLPDTAGVAYRTTHDKTTIIPLAVDAATRTMTYFHNAGLFGLSGDDFDGLFARPMLTPYVEAVRTERRQVRTDLVDQAVALVGQHLRRRPAQNPVERMAARLSADLPWLCAQTPEVFHVYSFGMLRQCGGTAALAADLARWFTQYGRPGLEPAAEAFTGVSEAAKVAQFRLARLARGRAGTLDNLTQMAEQWQAGIDCFVAWHER